MLIPYLINQSESRAPHGRYTPDTKDLIPCQLKLSKHPNVLKLRNALVGSWIMVLNLAALRGVKSRYDMLFVNLHMRDVAQTP